MIPPRLRRPIKRWVKRVWHTCVRRLWAFDSADLLSTLRSLGVARGDALFVHSSFDRFIGFKGTVGDLIRTLQAVIEPEGTLVMPTMPFTGTAVEHVAAGKVFDVLRTPSQVGLVTELFRRTPGVVRSVHPTHPVAAWGSKAESLIEGHHLASTPCGAGTPYLRLLEYDAKLLFLGTGVDAFTFYHGVEELLEPDMPFSPFTAEVFHLRSRDHEGRIVDSATRLFDPEWSRRRNMRILVPELKRRAVWREATIGGLHVILLACRDVLGTCRALAEQGVYCYDGAREAWRPAARAASAEVKRIVTAADGSPL